MSLSNPNLKNPATRFLQWRGGAENEGTKEKPEWKGGAVNYYDKATEETIEVKLPFTFIVLDELNTVSGYNEPEKSSFWSNEVRNITKDTLIVRTKAGVKGRGTWAQLADLKGSGAKYAKSVYIAFKDETGEFAIANIKVMGAALTAWIEFQKKYDVSQCAIYMSVNPEVQTKGKTKYFMPMFEAREISPEMLEECKVLDRELQTYLGAYFNRPPEDDKYATTAEELNTPVADVEIEDVEVKDGKTVPAEPAAEKPVEPATAADDDTIPTKDIPF